MRTKSDKLLRTELVKHGVEYSVKDSFLVFRHERKELLFRLIGENAEQEGEGNEKVIHLDQLLREPLKIAALVLSRLHLNKTVFARNCSVQKVEKDRANAFLDQYHIMNSTQSASNLGLYLDDELIALASFSKGRKMDRLPSEQRSFELIRFCCKSGITVTGGLTKLLKYFCQVKNAGDVMTYVDKQLSDGRSFLSAGFKKLGETAPNSFLVDRNTYERVPAGKEEVYEGKRFYLSRNAGNLKLVYTPVYN